MPENTTVLYVEDNKDNRTLVRRVLMAEGYNVLEAANATEAMKTLEEIIPDLILMDINMPDVDGFTLTAQIKIKPDFENVPIVALTANVMRGDREKSLDAGCDGYIQKPIDIDAIGNQIKHYLRS